jgi:hypothetical protein
MFAMFRFGIFFLSALVLVLIAGTVGCSKAPSESKPMPSEMTTHDAAGEPDADVSAALAALSEEDRRAAEAQKYCAVAQESLLGSMGEPVKLMIDGEPVFLCCEGCREAALEDPKATLAVLAKLKEANSPRP